MLRWKHRRIGNQYRADGFVDIADQYDDEAENFIVANPDLDVLRSLELPQPLGAIADAVASDAAATGASAVHVLVGALHAHEVAWRLAEGPRHQTPGSQMS